MMKGSYKTAGIIIPHKALVINGRDNTEKR